MSERGNEKLLLDLPQEMVRDPMSAFPKSPMRSPHKEEGEGSSVERIAEQYRAMLECIGEDPTRQGLRDTPVRAAKAIMFFTKVSSSI